MCAIVLGVGVLIWLSVSAGQTSGPLHRFDVDTANAINRRVAGHHVEVTLWKAITTVGAPLTWRVLAVVAAVLLWLQRRRRDAILVVIVMVAAFVVSSVVKGIVARPRPDAPVAILHVAGGSFPSGHSLTSAAGFGLVVVVTVGMPRRVRLVACWTAGVVALLVGLSRLALDVHYPTDVVGGWLFAALIVVITQSALGATLGVEARPRRRDGTIDADRRVPGGP